MKSFMNKTYKTTNFQGKSQTAGINQSPRSRSPNQSKYDNRLEGAAQPEDHHYTLEHEKMRMASTFNPASGDKFLPQVVNTPHMKQQNPDLFASTQGSLTPTLVGAMTV